MWIVHLSFPCGGIVQSFSVSLTVVRPLPEHLDLQLVIVVMRGGDLQAQVARGGRVKWGFGVRRRGGVGEVRGSRGGGWEGRRGGKWWWRRGRGKLIGEVFTCGGEERGQLPFQSWTDLKLCLWTENKQGSKRYKRSEITRLVSCKFSESS